MTFFLSLLYQERELYTADYWSPEATLVLLGLVTLAVIIFAVCFWWIRRRNAKKGARAK
jgi:hypothetical protein